MSFVRKLQKIIKKNNSLLCVGLDPDLEKIPKHLLKKSDLIFTFNKSIINDTYDLVCSYKLNIAFYSAHGITGFESLLKTIEYIQKTDPNIPIILDAKRGDVPSTTIQYAKEVFDVLNVDAVTVNPYLGFDSVEPFLKRKDKGIILLCRTSNLGASDFQDLLVDNEPLYIKVAKKVVEWDSTYHNCLMVIGATWPKQMKQIRELAKDMFFLVPGLGTQGGDLKETLRNGLNKEKSGLVLNSSRAILYASNEQDFAEIAREKAQETKILINQFR